jgi:hypothetical protein
VTLFNPLFWKKCNVLKSNNMSYFFKRNATYFTNASGRILYVSGLRKELDRTEQIDKQDG